MSRDCLACDHTAGSAGLALRAPAASVGLAAGPVSQVAQPRHRVFVPSVTGVLTFARLFSVNVKCLSGTERPFL